MLFQSEDVIDRWGGCSFGRSGRYRDYNCQSSRGWKKEGGRITETGAVSAHNNIRYRVEESLELRGAFASPNVKAELTEPRDEADKLYMVRYLSRRDMADRISSE